MNNFSQVLDKEKKLCLFSLAATFFWGLLAHGYGMIDSNFSHDSLNEFNSILFGNRIKIQAGRYLVPLYRTFSRTGLTLPWLIGILGLLWCGLAVYLVIRIFRIENRAMIFITAGIFTVNLTVSSLIATFLHDFDCDMLSLLLSVAAVFCWKAHPRGWPAGAVLLMMSLAFYQSYITTTVTLIIFVCILDLLDATPFRDVLIRGLKAVAMLLLGCVLYYITMRAVQIHTGNPMLTNNYNTADQALNLLGITVEELIRLVGNTYQAWYDKLVNAVSPYPTTSVAVSNLILAFICGIIFLGLLRKNVKLPEKLLCIALLILLPFAMNIMYFFSMGMFHELMRFAFWLTYFFALLLGRWLTGYLKEGNIPIFSGFLRKTAVVPTVVCILLAAIIVHGNVQTANAMYLKKDIEHDAYLSTVNRIVYRMESFDGYDPGVTPVVIIGHPEQINEIVPGFEAYRDPNGMYSSDVLCFSNRDRWQRYFYYVIMNPAVFASEDIWYRMSEDPLVADMPAYPAAGCMELIEGILVVKLS